MGSIGFYSLFWYRFSQTLYIVLQSLLIILAGIQKKQSSGDCDSEQEILDKNGRRGRTPSRASQASLAKGIY